MRKKNSFNEIDLPYETVSRNKEINKHKKFKPIAEDIESDDGGRHVTEES
jgi:hypothetical protein